MENDFLLFADSSRPKSIHDNGGISSENVRLTGGLSEASPVAQTLCTKAFQEKTGGWEVDLLIVNKNQKTSRFSIKRLTRQTNDTIQTEELFSNIENNSHGGQRLCVRTARARKMDAKSYASRLPKQCSQRLKAMLLDAKSYALRGQKLCFGSTRAMLRKHQSHAP
jgi:hypothetical protein